MHVHRPWQDDPDEHAAADRRTASLAGMAVTLLLLVVGLFLVQALRARETMEDCLLSGPARLRPVRCETDGLVRQ